MKVQFLKQLITLVLFMSFSTLYGGTKIPFDASLKAKIQGTFFDSESRLSIAKLDSYEESIKLRRDQIKQIITNEMAINDKLSGEKLEKKVKKSTDLKVFKRILKMVKKLRDITDTPEAYRMASYILELDYSMKIEGDILKSLSTISYVRESLKSWSIPKRNTPDEEASNLYNPETEEFYTHDELTMMSEKGEDLGLLNPDPRSTFWRKQENISSLNLLESNHQGRDPLHEGLSLEFPKNFAHFKKIRKSQSKPKIDVYIKVKDEDGKTKKKGFKLKVGLEMHSEPTVTSLVTALGYSADAVAYVRDFKMHLGKMTLAEFTKDWNSYYIDYNLEDHIKETGSDEDGNYIIWTEGLLEDKIKKDSVRVGPWAWGQNGHKGMREVRALLLFNMWVANADLKEAENNKLLYRKINDEHRFFNIQHDMGFAIGNKFREKPGAFPWNLVSSESKNRIHMNYSCFQKNSGFDHVTFNDGKWMAYQIAQLTREQIEDAVSLGGWPRSLDKLVAEKLINRRNQLVEAFRLLGVKTPQGKAIELLPVDTKLTTDDGRVVNGRLMQSNFEGYTQDFGNSFQEGLRPTLKGIEHQVIDFLRTNLNSLDTIDIPAEDFGLDDGIISKVILSLDRSITFNPHPSSTDDVFLVRDTFKVGFRLGFGFVVSGDAAFIKKYTIIYPVKSRSEGEYQGHFFLNLFLPYQIMTKTMPKRHVMISEDYLEGRGRIKVGLDNVIPITPVNLSSSLSASKIYLKRTLINKKYEEKVSVYEDKSIYNELAFRISASLWHLKLPIAKIQSSNGEINRFVYEVRNDEVASNKDLADALESAIRYNQLDDLNRFVPKRKIHSDFDRSVRRFGFFNFLQVKSLLRFDDIDVTDNLDDPDNLLEYEKLQLQSLRQLSWNLFDNGEAHDIEVTFSSKVKASETKDGGKELDSPWIHLSFQHSDKNTRNFELEKGYINFVNGCANNDKFINFTPSLHTVNKLWGHIFVFVDVFYYEDAIYELLSLNRNKFWDALAESMGITRGELDNARKAYVYKMRNKVPRFMAGINARMFSILHHAYIFLTNVKKAKRSNDPIEQMKYLVKGLRHIVWKYGASYQPMIMSALNKVVGKDKFYMKAVITMPSDSEKKLPDRKDIMNEMGVKKDMDDNFIIFNATDTLDLYHNFN